MKKTIINIIGTILTAFVIIVLTNIVLINAPIGCIPEECNKIDIVIGKVINMIFSTPMKYLFLLIILGLSYLLTKIITKKLFKI